MQLGGAALSEPIRALEFDSSARLLLAGGDDKTARVWDLQGGRLLHSWCVMCLEQEGELKALAHSSKGSMAGAVAAV